MALFYSKTEFSEVIEHFLVNLFQIIIVFLNSLHKICLSQKINTSCYITFKIFKLR